MSLYPSDKNIKSSRHLIKISLKQSYTVMEFIRFEINLW